MNVYIISKQYNDTYKICGATTDEERAKNLAKKFDANVLTFDTKQYSKYLKANVYSCKYNLKKLQISEVKQIPYEYCGLIDMPIKTNHSSDFVSAYVNADNENEAIALALNKINISLKGGRNGKEY